MRVRTMPAPGRLAEFTVEQRVLFHLWDHPLSPSEWEGRPELTQAGISKEVGIARKHLPRTLKRLLEQGYIDQETRHVPGARQRCRVYGLTESGKAAAEQVRASVLAREVLVEGEPMSISDLTGHDMPLLSVLSCIDVAGRFLPDGMGEEEEDEEGEEQDGESLYARILHRAWRDGKLTEDEDSMLDEVAMYLGLEPDIVERIHKEVESERDKAGEYHITVFLDVLEVAWLDNIITDDEQAMLTALAASLGIDEKVALEVQADWIDEHS